MTDGIVIDAVLELRYINDPSNSVQHNHTLYWICENIVLFIEIILLPIGYSILGTFNIRVRLTCECYIRK
jgi:hypothetical protein